MDDVLGKETKKCPENQGTDSFEESSVGRRSNPGQASTGSRGYFANRSSVFERLQRMNVLPFAVVMRAAWRQCSHRPIAGWKGCEGIYDRGALNLDGFLFWTCR